MLRFGSDEVRIGRGFAWLARQIVEGTITGIHPSPYRGVSIEFAEHRPYLPGDDPKHIDWRAYARTDRILLRESDEETNTQLWILLDGSASMNFRGDHSERSKWAYGATLAAAMAYMGLRQGDAVGLCLFDEKIRAVLPPKSNPRQFLRIAQTCETYIPKHPTHLGEICSALAEQRLRKRSLVILISDALDIASRVCLGLQRLAARKHDISLIRTLAWEEVHFPYRRPLRFKDMEGTQEQSILPRSQRESYLEKFAAHAEEIQRACRQLRIPLTTVMTNQPLSQAFARCWQARYTRTQPR